MQIIFFLKVNAIIDALITIYMFYKYSESKYNSYSKSKCNWYN